MRGYIPPRTDEERLLMRRVADLVGAVRARGGWRSTDFLNDRQQELARAALAALSFENCRWEGGYPDAERRVLCLYEEEPPESAALLECLLIEVPHDGGCLTHRDYLGALLSLGIRRGCVGDILPAEGGAFVFVLPKTAPLLTEALVSVGKSAVHVRSAAPEAILQVPERSEKTASVASLRLDAVLAAMLRISRSAAAALVQSGRVEVNHVEVTQPHYEVYENDRFSIRGMGKYKLCAVGEKSRKGRTYISYFEF